MPEISRRTGELVRYLQQSANLLERVIGRALDPATLAELEEIGDVNALPHLVALAITSNRESRRRLMSIAVATWQRVPRATLVALDSSYRATWWTPGTDSRPWDRFSPADVVTVAGFGDDAWALVAVATFHARGYVREAAVRALDATTTGNELQFLIVRLNDWVDEVAERARDAVMRRVDPAWAPIWAANLAVVQRLSAASRRDHSQVIDAVFELLRRPASRDALELALGSDDRATRRIAHRLAQAGADGDDRLRLVRRALSDPDNVVRFDAFRRASDVFEPATLDPIVEQAFGDAFMPIRRQALLTTIERFPDAIAARARRALLDSSPAMRELGRFALAKHEPGTSVPEFYRRALRSDNRTEVVVAAIAGLAETGDVPDALLVAPQTSDTRARVRREAIRAVGHLAPDSNAATLISALADPSARVARAAREALAANPTLIDFETLRSAIAHAPFVHGRIQAIGLATTLGKWSHLQLLLHASHSVDPEVGAEVQAQILRWLAKANERSTAPKPEQVASITALLSRSSTWINDYRCKQLRGFLDPWKPNALGN